MAVTRFPMGHIRDRELHEATRRLEAERLSAPGLVEDALRRTPRDQWNTLADRPSLITIGAIEQLEKFFDAEMTRDPKRAEAVARLALSLSEALPPQIYPAVTLAQTKARAWKNVGKILSYLARHDEANVAFAHAERYLEPFFALAHDRAILRLNLAINYLDMARYSDARPLLTNCKEVFRDHADMRLYVLAGFYEGVLLQRQHLYREARETYLLLIVSKTGIPSDTLAALYLAIGRCSMELRDYESAEENLLIAVELNKADGRPLEAVRAELARGRLLIRRGLPDLGIKHLRPVRHQFLKHSLAEEAGICGLDMVEGLLLLGLTRQAESLSRTILGEFLAASLNTRAITALGYLAEAIAAHEATPRHAVQVREYVLSLRTTPEREFATPQLATDGES